MIEYILFCSRRRDDIDEEDYDDFFWDDDGNELFPLTLNHWFDNFYDLEECKDWIQEHPIGSRSFGMPIIELFAVSSDKLIDFKHYVDGEAIICIKTIGNAPQWKHVKTKTEAEAFVSRYSARVAYFVETKHLELHEVEELEKR